MANEQQQKELQQQRQQEGQQQSVVCLYEIPAGIAATASTIIDIPSPCKSQHSTGAASISSTLSSSSSSSTSYDTDTSTVSSTCCTRHGEHIYMQRTIIVGKQQQQQQMQQQQQQQQQQLQQHQQQQHHNAKDIEADAAEVDYKDEHKKSWPIFILLISIIEISIFVYDLATIQMQQQQQQQQQQQDLPMSIPNDSVFIYRPDRRLQVWRFVSYMFLHANWFHLGFNVVVQLFYGVPLEVMHGSARVAVIYFAGVFAGSLGTSVVDSEVYLVGASGGVYGILAAHLANITLNYGQMKYAVAQLVSVVIFVSCDLGYAFYTQYLAVIELTKTPPVSYIAHLTGALAGLTIGLLVLKNFEHRSYENVIWWLALGVYCAFTVFAIVFNLINTVTAQLMEEQSEVITQHLLHDLGVS